LGEKRGGERASLIKNQSGAVRAMKSRQGKDGAQDTKGQSGRDMASRWKKRRYRLEEFEDFGRREHRLTCLKGRREATTNREREKRRR